MRRMPLTARLASVTLIFATMLATPSVAAAQEDPALPLNKTIGAILRSAARVHVWTRDGRRVVGSRAHVGDQTLDLWVDGTRRSLWLDDLRRIDVANRDSLKNGAVTGAVTFALLCALVCGQGLDEPGQLKHAVAVNIAFGALVGAGIDAAVRQRRTVYVRSAVTPTVGSRGMLSYQRRF